MSCLSLSRLCSPASFYAAAPSSPDSSSSSSSSFSSSDYLCPTEAKSSNGCGCLCVTMPNKTGSGSECQFHLEKHVHLTNCIHLKNRFHMQKHRMMMEGRHNGELPLMKELNSLSRAKSLRDPATTSTWKSPLMKGVPGRRSETHRDDSRGKDRSGRSAKPEVSAESVRDPVVASRQNGNVENLRNEWDGQIVSYAGDDTHHDHDKSRMQIVENGECGRNRRGARASHNREVYDIIQIARDRVPKKTRRHDTTIAKSKGREELKSRGKEDGQHTRKDDERKDKPPTGKPMSALVENVAKDSGLSPSPLSLSGYGDAQNVGHALSLLGIGEPRSEDGESCESVDGESSDQGAEEATKTGLGSRSQSPLLARDSSRGSEGRARGSKKSPVSGEMVKVREGNNLQIDFHDRRMGSRSSHMSTADGAATMDDEIDGAEPRHGCGIPWYWSKLHKHKGKGFFDLAGRSMSCAYSDVSKRKGDNILARSQSGSGRELIAAAYVSDRSVSSANSDAEALPLLTEPEASLASADVAASSVEVDSDVPSRETFAGFGFDTRRRRRNGHAGTDILQGRLKERLGWVGLHGRMGHDEGRHRSLSQKYRPKSFRDIIGQNVIVQSLCNAVFRGKIAPVYLFQGPRGTGKTSAAKIFASALNCLSSEELRPCGLCRECIALNLGKSLDILEVNAGGHTGVENMKQLVDNVALSPSTGRYRVFIIDECHLLPNEAWNIFVKNLEEPPGHTVIILISTSPEHIPKTVISRCQKFAFTKIKDSDIVAKLQKIASKENLEIDVDAVSLIASQSDGSLRDAETTLEQLALLGQVIRLATVQELVGLIPDDKLLALLDLALSGDTVNTVKAIRELLDSGVEPLTLMSQLASLITNILAGSLKLPNDQSKRRFFYKHSLNKDDVERLKRALRTLSEAEKQVRASSDQPTWLTAALLQFAPDCSLMPPTSSTGTSATPSITPGNDTSEKEAMEWESKQVWDNEEQFDHQHNETAIFSMQCGTVVGKDEIMNSGLEFSGASNSVWSSAENRTKSLSTLPEARIHPCDYSPLLNGRTKDTTNSFPVASSKDTEVNMRVSGNNNPKVQVKNNMNQRLDDVWQRVIKECRTHSIRQLLRNHGKLVSVSIQEVYAVARIEFQKEEHKLKADRSRTNISHAFQAVLSCPVEVQIRLIAAADDGPTHRASKCQAATGDVLERKHSPVHSTLPGKCEKLGGSTASSPHVPLKSNIGNQNGDGGGSPMEHKGFSPNSCLTKEHALGRQDEDRLENAWVQGAQDSPIPMGPVYSDIQLDVKMGDDLKHTTRPVSLGFVIQQVEGCPGGYAQEESYEHVSGPLKLRKVRHLGPDIEHSRYHDVEEPAPILEHQNLRIEHHRKKCCVFCCWRIQRSEDEKPKHRRRRRRRVAFLLRLVACTRALTPCALAR